jgi:hypothetical protein
VKRKRIRLGLMLTLVVIAAVASIGPVSSAVAFFSRGLSLDVQINSPATLAARGAALKVPLNVLCTSQRAEVSVQVSERVGSRIAQGYSDQLITCTGDIQPFTATVFANGNAFKKGQAVATAQIFGCGFGTCGSETDSAQIAVVRK